MKRFGSISLWFLILSVVRSFYFYLWELGGGLDRGPEREFRFVLSCLVNLNCNTVCRCDFLHGHLFPKASPNVAFSRFSTLYFCLKGGSTFEATFKKNLINILQVFLVSCRVERVERVERHLWVLNITN